MRISTATSFYAPVESMLRQQAEIERTQREISTGQNLKALAENPAQAAQASDLDRYLAASERYAVNADIAAGRLKTGESTVTAGIDLLQRARELAVQGANDSLDVTARKAIAHEVRSINDQLLALANRRSESGEYIFAGSRISAEPFGRASAGAAVSYLGDAREREIPISATRSISDGFAGDEIFMHVTAGNGSFTTAADAGNTGTATMTTGSVTNGALWGSAAADGPFTIEFSNVLGVTKYRVTSDDGTEIVPPTNYQSGASISFNGVQVSVQGAPNAGDAFTVNPTLGADATESVFDTLDRLASALETSPLTTAVRAQVSTELGGVLQQVDQAISNLSDTRSSIAARLQVIDESENFRQEQDISVKETLSKLRDVDFAEALARLNAQMTALQVAQQAYSRISSRTLFDYL